MLRCPVCRGYSFRPGPAGGVVCGLCSLAARQAEDFARPLDIARYGREDGGYAFPNWNTPLSRLFNRLGRGDGGPWFFSPQSVHALAHAADTLVVRLGSALTRTGPVLPGQRAPWLIAELEPVPEGDPETLRRTLGLGLITRPADFDDVAALVQDMSALVGEIVICVDGDSEDTARQFASRLQSGLTAWCGMTGHRLEVFAHPLERNFGAQRNRVRDRMTRPWVLQLDSDERLTERAKQRLPGLLVEADRHGFDLFGFARRNLVDGTMSAFYPDTAYRLARRHIPWRREVHEYLDVADYRRRALSPGADMLHFMSSARLPVRQHFYETILAGGGRPDDRAMLETPLDILLP